MLCYVMLYYRIQMCIFKNQNWKYIHVFLYVNSLFQHLKEIFWAYKCQKLSPELFHTTPFTFGNRFFWFHNFYCLVAFHHNLLPQIYQTLSKMFFSYFQMISTGFTLQLTPAGTHIFPPWPFQACFSQWRLAKKQLLHFPLSLISPPRQLLKWYWDTKVWNRSNYVEVSCINIQIFDHIIIIFLGKYQP